MDAPLNSIRNLQPGTRNPAKDGIFDSKPVT